MISGVAEESWEVSTDGDAPMPAQSEIKTSPFHLLLQWKALARFQQCLALQAQAQLAIMLGVAKGRVLVLHVSQLGTRSCVPWMRKAALRQCQFEKQKSLPRIARQRAEAWEDLFHLHAVCWTAGTPKATRQLASSLQHAQYLPACRRRLGVNHCRLVDYKVTHAMMQRPTLRLNRRHR